MGEKPPAPPNSRGCLAKHLCELLAHQPGTIDPNDEHARQKFDELTARFLEFRRERLGLSSHLLGCFACERTAVVAIAPVYYEAEPPDCPQSQPGAA